MPKTRSWQESFDMLEAARRAERHLADADTRNLRDAEAAYARAAALEAGKSTPPAFLLPGTGQDSDEPLVSPKPAVRKGPVKKGRTKTAPRKRAAARRTAEKARPKLAKPDAVKPRKSALAAQPTVDLPASPAQPAQPAELHPVTPLPRSAALAPYRKPGLFGLIGSWLRIAKRQTASGFAGGARRTAIKPKPHRHRDELAELRAENESLRRQLEALLAFQENKSGSN